LSQNIEKIHLQFSAALEISGDISSLLTSNFNDKDIKQK